MHSAIVTSWDQPPKHVEVATPPLPAPDSGLIQLKLIAAGIHRLVRSRASGQHFTATTLPHTPGIDGTASTPDGKLVYFTTLGTDLGSMSEYINLPKHFTVPLPEGLDPIQAAALPNPAMASWMALKKRTQNLPKDFTVLILGATTTSGNLAIPIARSFGAGKVIGVARNSEALNQLPLDQKIVLQNPIEKTDFSMLGDVDVILDFLYGAPAAHLLSQLKSQVPTQYVHIGGMAGMEMDLPGAVLRSKDITIRGSGPGAWSVREMVGEYAPLLEAIKGFEKVDVRVEKLVDVEKTWAEEGQERLVYVP